MAKTTHSTPRKVTPEEARARLPISDAQLAEIAQRWHLKLIAMTGDILYDGFGPASDIDLVVEFTPGADIPPWGQGGLSAELSGLAGRTVYPLSYRALMDANNRSQSLVTEMVRLYAD